jgi:hypothetical protein
MPRRWFRFHLTTAVVAVLVIGGLLGANLSEVRQDIHLSLFPIPGSNDRPGAPSFSVQYFGWPKPACYRYIRFRDGDGKPLFSDGNILFTKKTQFHWIWDDNDDHFGLIFRNTDEPWRPWRSFLIIDVFVAIVTLLGGILFSEYLIRRKNPFRQSEPELKDGSK